MVGLAVLYENVPYTFICNYQCKINKFNVNQSIIKLESLLCRQILRNISLQLVSSTQFSSERLVLSTCWQTGVVFRVTMTTDTVI